MTLQDIAVLRDKTPRELEVEVFVHGALCMSVSGRCLLSNYMAGRDANRGECAQPCRWKYYLSEETRPGQLYEIGENENGSYILNANDMCTAPFLDLICKAGVDSLKIEGACQDLLLTMWQALPPPTAGRWTLIWPTRSTTTLSCLLKCTRSSPVPVTATIRPASTLAGSRPVRLPTVPTYIREWEFVGTVDGWGERRCLLPAAGQVEPRRHAGSALPGWPQHPAEPRVDRKRSR